MQSNFPTMKLTFGIAILFIIIWPTFADDSKWILIHNHPNIFSFFEGTTAYSTQSRVSNSALKSLCKKVNEIIEFTHVPYGQPLPQAEAKYSEDDFLCIIEQRLVSFFPSGSNNEYFVRSNTNNDDVIEQDDGTIVGILEKSVSKDTSLKKQGQVESSFMACQASNLQEHEFYTLFRAGQSTQSNYNLCDRDALTQFRICSSIYPILMKFYNTRVSQVNYIRAGTGTCVNQASIQLLGMPHFSSEPLLVNNMMPCSVNAEWDSPTFYVLIDRMDATRAFVLIRNQEFYSVVMRVVGFKG